MVYIDSNKFNYSFNFCIEWPWHAGLAIYVLLFVPICINVFYVYIIFVLCVIFVNMCDNKILCTDIFDILSICSICSDVAKTFWSFGVQSSGTPGELS